MKNYVKPLAEIVEIRPEEELLADQLLPSSEWGYDDGTGGGWED